MNIQNIPASDAPTSRSILFDAPAEWSEIVTITPEKAALWLTDFAFAGQRKVNEKHVSFLANEMAAGRFSTSEMRLVHTPKGTMLTNGQHRLCAVVASGISIRVNVYHLRGDGDVSTHDYQATDIGRQRTMQERLNVDPLEWRKELSNSQFNELGAAMGPIIGGFAAQSFSGSHPIARSLGERLIAMEAWIPEARAFYKIAHGVGTNASFVCRRRAVFSVCLVTLRYQEEKALEFWTGVLQDDRLASGDPRKTLLQFLYSNRAASIKTPVYPRYVASAWNAFFKGEKLQFLRLRDASKPITLAGTPYNGKRLVESIPSAEKA